MMKCKNLRLRKCRRPNFELTELFEMLECLEENQELATGVLGSVVKTIADQRVAWDAITERVNAVSTHNRTRREIREKWRDLKARVKTKAVANARFAMSKASGSPPATLNALEQRVLKLVGKVFRIDEITRFGFYSKQASDVEPSSPLAMNRSSVEMELLSSGFDNDETIDGMLHVKMRSSSGSPVSLDVKDEFHSCEPVLTESAEPRLALLDSTRCTGPSISILPLSNGLPVSESRPRSADPTTTTSLGENHFAEVDSILCSSIKELISLQQKIYSVEAQRLAVEQQRLQVEKQRLEIDKKKFELKERTLIWKLHRSD